MYPQPCCFCSYGVWFSAFQPKLLQYSRGWFLAEKEWTKKDGCLCSEQTNDHFFLSMPRSATQVMKPARFKGRETDSTSWWESCKITLLMGNRSRRSIMTKITNNLSLVRTSLKVQWLRACLPTKEHEFSPRSREDPTCI